METVRGRLALAGLLLAATGGCAMNNSVEVAGPSASAVQHPTLEGVPIPSGFRLVDDRSVAASSGPLRVVKYEFAGPTDASRVNRFYRDYMPAGGWTLRREAFDRGEQEMRFTSTAEECTVRIGKDGRQTIVRIDVIPLPRGTAQREARPPLRATNR
ncbi:MAG: hypothetical protein KDA32_07990 [Phycisphaerales bacterium]|nr:hypothetical protein [Phycisphaerales bacterium]